MSALPSVVSATPTTFAASGASASSSVSTDAASGGDNDSASDADTPSDKQQGIVYQYFFVILVVGVIVFIAFLFIMRRRRKRRKITAASLGRNALARDIESWQASHGGANPAPAAPPNTARRWMQRYNRFASRHPNRIAEEDENGLNELGEAPPPYKPGKSAMDDGAEPRRDSHSDAATLTAPSTPAVPLRTLSRNAVGKPPGYEEAVRPVVDSTSSLAVDQQLLAPHTRQVEIDQATADLVPPRSSSSPAPPPFTNSLPRAQPQLGTNTQAPSSSAKTPAEASTSEMRNQ